MQQNTPRIRFKKYVTSVFVNKNAEPYQFKNTRTLRMVVGCYVIGKYSLISFPAYIHLHEASLEILPPIILITICFTIPLTFMCFGISQYSKKGWMKLWDAEPVWRGIGIAGIICLFIATLKNHSLSTYFLYYTIRALEADPPWLQCGNQSFLEDGCFTFRDNRSMRLDCMDMHGEEHCTKIEWKNSAKYFWDNLAREDLKGNTSFPYNANLILYQAAVTILVYICVRHSTESLAIFSPFLLLFPTLLHGLLLIRSFLHPGTLRGLEAVWNFKLSNITNIFFWADLCSLSLCSTGFVYGGLCNLGTLYDFRHPVNIDAVFINITSVVYSLMYSVFLYNIYGILSYELNIPLAEIVNIDSEDNFIQCAMSFTHMSMSKFWTVTFYLSNFLMVLRSLAVQCEMFLTVFYELKPDLKRFTIPCGLVFCTTHFLCLLVTNFDVLGNFIVHQDIIMVYIIVPVIAMFLYFFLSHFYGVMHFVDDMHFMLGFRSSNLWTLNWYIGFMFYVIVSFLCMFNFYGEEDVETNTFVLYANIIATAVICLIPLIYFVIFVIVKHQKNVSIFEVFKSAKEWGPRDEVLRKSRDMFSAHDMTKEYLYRQHKLRSRITETPAPKPIIE